jgi:hypothetical protein
VRLGLSCGGPTLGSRVLLVAAGAILAGCPYKVTLTAQPATAEVTLPGGDQIALPADVKARYVPFGHQRIRATADGFRDLEVDLRAEEVRLFSLVVGTLAHPSTLWGRPRGEVRLVLVPEHGPAGTWTPDEIP